MSDKVASMRDAVAALVRDGDTVAIEGFIREVRGIGLMLGIEFDTPDHAEEVQWECLQKGLLVLECGKSTVRMCPALTVTEAEMDTGLGLFAEAVAEVAAEG